MHAQLIQHPVGQGGFLSGVFEDGKSQLRWVYDCGSNQHDSLLREIRIVAGKGNIDLLFLSHLDSDHVSGIDALLAACKVEEVVLPYLQPEALAAILARDAANGALTGTMLDVAGDLPTWFLRRGVARITFVDDDNGDAAPPPVRPAGDGGEGPIGSTWQPSPREEPGAVWTDTNGITTSLVVQRATASAALQAVQGPAAMDWLLIPHVHAPPAKLMTAFTEALEQRFGTLEIEKISDAARTAEGREDLRRCYDALWLDHNLVSMTLYAGPATGQDTVTVATVARRTKLIKHFKESGWLLTGDAHLDRKSRRDACLRRYAGVLPQIGVLLLPHHGSARNFHDDVLWRLPGLQLGIAAAGPNRYGHPHPVVKAAVRAYGKIFRRVGHRRGARITANVIWVR